MPVINMTMGELTTEQKKEIVEKVTATLMDITNIPEEEFTTIIHELPYENLGRGKKTIQEKLDARK